MANSTPATSAFRTPYVVRNLVAFQIDEKSIGYAAMIATAGAVKSGLILRLCNDESYL
jgi:hypothetical protein